MSSVIHMISGVLLGYSVSTLLMCLVFACMPSKVFDVARDSKYGSPVLGTILLTSLILGTVISPILL